MAQINERIKFFIDKLTLKTALMRKGQLIALKEEVGKNLTKAIKDKNHKLIFSSQELRSLTMKIEKVHKQANKQIAFDISENRLFSRLDKIKDEIKQAKTKEEKTKIRSKAYSDETAYIAEYMALARDLQMLLSCFNYYAIDVSLLEQIAEQDKEKDDKILKEELEFILFELMGENNE